MNSSRCVEYASWKRNLIAECWLQYLYECLLSQGPKHEFISAAKIRSTHLVSPLALWHGKSTQEGWINLDPELTTEISILRILPNSWNIWEYLISSVTYHVSPQTAPDACHWLNRKDVSSAGKSSKGNKHNLILRSLNLFLQHISSNLSLCFYLWFSKDQEEQQGKAKMKCRLVPPPLLFLSPSPTFLVGSH